jgi:hypothetical protein
MTVSFSRRTLRHGVNYEENENLDNINTHTHTHTYLDMRGCDCVCFRVYFHIEANEMEFSTLDFLQLCFRLSLPPSFKD